MEAIILPIPDSLAAHLNKQIGYLLRVVLVHLASPRQNGERRVGLAHM